MPSIAITGGIAEGKSTVLGYLAELGYRTASADLIAREIFQDSAVNAELASIAGVPNPVSREQLRLAIETSSEIRRGVNRLMHSRVFRVLRSSGAQFLEIPLLIETCTQHYFAKTWVVTCGPEEQRRRLLLRYKSELAVDRVLAAQLPTQAKLPFADAIFRTNQPEEHVLRMLRAELVGISVQ